MADGQSGDSKALKVNFYSFGGFFRQPSPTWILNMIGVSKENCVFKSHLLAILPISLCPPHCDHLICYGNVRLCCFRTLLILSTSPLSCIHIVDSSSHNTFPCAVWLKVPLCSLEHCNPRDCYLSINYHTKPSFCTNKIQTLDVIFLQLVIHSANPVVENWLFATSVSQTRSGIQIDL